MFMNIQMTIYPCNMMNHVYVGRLSLKPYLTAGMEVTRKGKACTAMIQNAMQLDINWMKNNVVDSSKESSPAIKNTLAENIVNVATNESVIKSYPPISGMPVILSPLCKPKPSFH